MRVGTTWPSLAAPDLPFRAASSKSERLKRRAVIRPEGERRWRPAGSGSVGHLTQQSTESLGLTFGRNQFRSDEYYEAPLASLYRRSTSPGIRPRVGTSIPFATAHARIALGSRLDFLDRDVAGLRRRRA